jgi:hypothetical protein
MSRTYEAVREQFDLYFMVPTFPAAIVHTIGSASDALSL